MGTAFARIALVTERMLSLSFVSSSEAAFGLPSSLTTTPSSDEEAGHGEVPGEALAVGIILSCAGSGEAEDGIFAESEYARTALLLWRELALVEWSEVGNGDVSRVAGGGVLAKVSMSGAPLSAAGPGEVVRLRRRSVVVS